MTEITQDILALCEVYHKTACRVAVEMEDGDIDYAIASLHYARAIAAKISVALDRLVDKEISARVAHNLGED